MRESIEIFAAVNFFVIGMSHIVQHRAWAEFFAWLCEKGRPGAFVNGFLSLIIGSLIVAFHNVWSGIPIVLTIIGWGMVIKSLVIFVNPDWGVRSMARVRADNSRIMIVAGLIFVTVAAALGYNAWESWA